MLLTIYLWHKRFGLSSSLSQVGVLRLSALWCCLVSLARSWVFSCYGRILAIEFSGAVTPGSIGLAPAFIWFNQNERLSYTQSTALFTAEVVTDSIIWALAVALYDCFYLF